MELETKIQFLSGVGPKMAEKLERLGIKTVRDLLFYWPRDWQDFSHPRKISSLRIDEKVIIKGKITSIEAIRSPKRWMSIINANLTDETGEIKAVWFNQNYLLNTLHEEDEWLVAGRVGWDFKGKQKTLSPFSLEKEPVILPIYPETEGLTSKFIRKILLPILARFNEDLEFLPADLLKSEKLLNLKEAIINTHFPEDMQKLQYAKERLAFNELFMIALRFLSIKKELQQNNGPKMIVDEGLLKNFAGQLPFMLTNAQRKSAWEIIQDLARPIPMNRLLEGDVGSGKTVVAAMAALVAINNKYQVAWLAPTEILANQHFQNMQKLLSPSGIKVGLLTGANKQADLIRDDLIIGTHAVIQKNVEIPNLGLIIIDEQHRFGVKQRAHLRSEKLNQKNDKSFVPHLLSMTATPIPRTLALALYGDLDLSIIDELPKNRQKIITEIIEPNDRTKTYDFIRNEIKAGRQAFVICPLIEQSESSMINLFDSDKKSAAMEYEKLSQKIFPELKIGLMHGKLKSKEKDDIMTKFANGEIDILVSTAVVEVGIDIANASVMMIESAERFGLAQLHQFRGRVGRGANQSYCFLFSESDSQKSRERLRAMTESNNGFELAQKDLELRGPGEIIGLVQSGVEDLKMASLADTINLSRARLAAEKIIEEGLDNYPKLRVKLKEFELSKHLE